MNLEQYVAKRKKEDEINEYDLSKRAENTRICVNYIFEYYNDYVDTVEAIEKPLDPNDKIEKYRRSIRRYSPEIQDWLVSLYSEYGKYTQRALENTIDEDVYFLLYDSTAEFRALSYSIYAKVIKRYPYLKNQTEMVYQFILDYHRIRNHMDDSDEIIFGDDIEEWIAKTYEKHGVNICEFCSTYINRFFDDPSLWPLKTRVKSKYYDEYNEYRKKGKKVEDYMLWEYDYKKAIDPFNINQLYRNMPKKSFTRGKKEEFSIVMMYYACEYNADMSFWDEYKEKKNV